MEKLIIATFGQKESGKDTLCDYICKLLNLSNNINIIWKRNSFAGAVKKIFADAFNVDLDFIEKWKRNSEIPDGFLKNVRESLQFIGDGFRKIYENVWIDICLRTENPQIISDGRYFNEAKSVKKYKGFNILIYRPGYENNDTNASEAEIKPLLDWCKNNLNPGIIPLNKESPENLKYFDYFIINDGNLEQYYSNIFFNLVPVVLKYFY